MFKVDVQADATAGSNGQDAALIARRQREEERKQRIFDSRKRTMGLDLAALQQQIDEKKQREALEREREQLMDAEMIRQDKIVQLLQQRQQEDMRAMRRAEQEFRVTQQAKETRREFDLNNPQAVRAQRPPRTEEDEGEDLGPSSIQVFSGEDLTSAARQQLQAEQMRSWSEQQTELKRQQREEEDATFRIQELREKEVMQRAAEMMDAEEEARQGMVRATQQYNLRMAEEKRRRREEEKMMQAEESVAQMAAQVQDGGMLSENPLSASTSGSRGASDRYKGMTPAEIAQVRQAQQQQMEEAQRRKQQEKEDEDDEARQLELLMRHAALEERKAERARKDMMHQQAKENQRLAEEQRTRRLAEKDDKGAIGDSFFSKFNTSSR